MTKKSRAVMHLEAIRSLASQRLKSHQNNKSRKMNLGKKKKNTNLPKWIKETFLCRRIAVNRDMIIHMIMDFFQPSSPQKVEI